MNVLSAVFQSLQERPFVWSWRFWGIAPTKEGVVAKYFKPEEIVGLDAGLVSTLDSARAIAGIPFIITSGKRSEEENKKDGGVGDSSHLKGLAVDLRAQDSISRFKIASALMVCGFKRLGIYNLHIHADLDPELPQNVLWTGVSH